MIATGELLFQQGSINKMKDKRLKRRVAAVKTADAINAIEGAPRIETMRRRPFFCRGPRKFLSLKCTFLQLSRKKHFPVTTTEMYVFTIFSKKFFSGYIFFLLSVTGKFRTFCSRGQKRSRPNALTAFCTFFKKRTLF